MMPANSDRFSRLLIAVCLAIAFWISDSIIHFSGYGEPRFEFIPTEFNEFWMRALICVLIVGYGALSGRHIAVLAEYRAREDAARAQLRRYEDVYGNAIVGLHLLVNKAPGRDLPPDVFYAEATKAIAAAVRRMRELSSEQPVDAAIVRGSAGRI